MLGPSSILLGHEAETRGALFVRAANASVVGTAVQLSFKITGSNAQVFAFETDPYFVTLTTVAKPAILTVNASNIVKVASYTSKMIKLTL